MDFLGVSRTFLLALVPCLSSCTPEPSQPTASHAAYGPLGFVSVDSDQRVHVSKPESTTTLRARVLDAEGAPVAGARVEYLAPDRGPSGRFDDGAISFRTESDADGFVSADFHTGEESGAFFVSAYQAAGPGVAHFAVSVTTEMPDDAGKSAALARAEALKDSDVLGPLYLPSGTSLSDRGAAVEHADGGTWLTWSIPSITSRLGSRSTFFVSPALTTSETCSLGEVSHDTEHPLDARLEGRSWSLAPPIRANAELPGVELPELEAQSNGSTSQALSVQGDECAVLVRGDPDFWDAIPSHLDMAAAYHFFGKRRRVAHLIPPITDSRIPTYDDFVQYLAQARNTGCKKVFLYMSGHASGWSQHPNFFMARRTAAGPDDPVSEEILHATMAQAVEDILGPSITEITVIVDSCHSERAIQAYQGRGLSGYFLTGAQHGQSAHTLPTGSVFTRVLFDSWAEDAVGNANSVMSILKEEIDGNDFNSLLEPSRYALKWKQTASVVPIEPDFVDWEAKSEPGTRRAPDARVPLGPDQASSTQTIQLLRPVDALISRPGVDFAPMDIQISITDPAIAKIDVGDELVSEQMQRLQARIAGTEFQVVGLAHGVTTYVVEGRAWHHAFRGTGTLIVGDGQCPLGEACPKPATACDARLPVSVVAETELGPNTVEEVGLPVVSSHGDVLVWGIDGVSGYSLFPSSGISKGPLLGAHDSLPVTLNGQLTTAITRRGSMPRVLGDDGSFGFAADLLVGPHVDEQAALAWQDGALVVLGKTTAHDPSRRMSEQVRSNGKGTFAWAVGDLTNDDLGAHHEVHTRRLDQGCSRKVLAMGDPYPLDEARVVTALRLHGVDAEGRLILFVRHRPKGTPEDDPDDAHAILVEQDGDFQALLRTGDFLVDSSQVLDIDGVSTDPPTNTVLAYVNTEQPNDHVGQTLLLSSGGGTPRILSSALEGVDPADANEMTNRHDFVGDGRVAFNANLLQTDSSSPNYGPRGSALFIERASGVSPPLLVMREGEPAPCRPGWVFSSLTLPEVQVFFAGADRVYVKAAIRSTTDTTLGRYGLWLVENDTLSPVFIQGEPLALPGHGERTPLAFGMFEKKSASGNPDYPDSAVTNSNGQIVLAIQYDDGVTSSLSRGIWLIGK